MGLSVQAIHDGIIVGAPNYFIMNVNIPNIDYGYIFIGIPYWMIGNHELYSLPLQIDILWENDKLVCVYYFMHMFVINQNESGELQTKK